MIEKFKNPVTPEQHKINEIIDAVNGLTEPIVIVYGKAEPEPPPAPSPAGLIEVVTDEYIVMEPVASLRFLDSGVLQIVRESAREVYDLFPDRRDGRLHLIQCCPGDGVFHPESPAHAPDGRVIDWWWYDIEESQGHNMATCGVTMSFFFDLPRNLAFLLALMHRHNPWEFQAHSVIKTALYNAAQTKDKDRIFQINAMDDQGHDCHCHARAKVSANE